MNPKTIIPAFIFILLRGCFSADAQVLEQDSLALVAFYNSTGGPNWKKNTNWLTGPVSTWYGVKVENGRVTELGKEGSFSFNNLTGQLPTEIGHLTALRILISGNNPDLSGAIPEEIGNLHELVYFGIGNSSLTGTIPRSIGNCISLKSLSLRENNITGQIPLEIGNLDSLLFLKLHNNELSGAIPAELGNCFNLKELRLNNNNLSGSLPAELASLNNLISLNISFNNLSGAVPKEFAFQSSYYFFTINDNNFDYLPPFNNWQFLSGLNVKNNMLTFEYLESHAQAGYMWFDYSPQAEMLETVDTVLTPGSNYSIYSGTGGDNTNYMWYKNGALLLESMEAHTLYLENISYTDTGTYICYAENSWLPLLTLERKPVHIAIDTSINITNHPPNRVLSVYPNPASDRLTIDTPGIPEQYHITLFSLNGEPVLQHTVKNQHTSTHELTIKGLAAGIYLLQLQTEKETFTTKFTKIRQKCSH